MAVPLAVPVVAAAAAKACVGATVAEGLVGVIASQAAKRAIGGAAGAGLGTLGLGAAAAAVPWVMGGLAVWQIGKFIFGDDKK